MEATMSEVVSNAAECKNLQSLFIEYNQRYFGARLPRYKILPTNDRCRCEWHKRRIYINPHEDDASVSLLHEMVHAAVGRGHGKVFLDEVRRLVELGAPAPRRIFRSRTERTRRRDMVRGSSVRGI